MMLIRGSCGMNVFFFKQKTAYEMRISDWSSDVCSSDLMSRVEADRVIVDRMNNDRASPGDLRGGRTAAERIGKQIGAKAEPLEVGSDGQPSDQQQRHLVRHALSQLCVGQRRALLQDRKSVVSGKSVSVRVDLGGSRIINKKTINENTKHSQHTYHIHHKTTY